MNDLPNYFLADLPADASLSASLITEACQTLKRNRTKYLADRPTSALIRALHRTGENWLDEEYPLRRFTLERGPEATGFSRATIAAGLDAFFRQLNGESLEALLTQELGHPQRLDTMVGSMTETRSQRMAMANGPEFLVHVAAGNIPNPAMTSMVLGLLTRSAQFVKCARGTSFLPRLFAHSIYDSEPKLGACLELAEWRGGTASLENALFAEADCVTATGSDEAILAIKEKLPVRTRFVSHGHRVSFGYVTRDALSAYNAKKNALRAAADVAAWNQHGCLSPHLFYAEDGGDVTPEIFAEMLADALDKREQAEPRGSISTEAAAGIASRRAFYEVRAAHSPGTKHWCSLDSTAWTVVYESEPLFALSCLNRFVYVKKVQNLDEALRAADAMHGKVSTVGVAGTLHQTQELAVQLARWGVTRVCPLGQMQNPPLSWRHDGRTALADLVTWTDWEQ